MSEVELKIKNILDNKVKFPFDYSRDLHLLNDLSIDSVELLELIVEIEDEFDIVFGDEDMDINIIASIRSLINLVELKINK